MKRGVLIFIATFILCYKLQAQFSTSVIEITKTYSQNGNFYIKCIPYDSEDPSLRGKSFVYNKNNKLQYTIDRDFNGLRENGNFLSISNDGKTIFYAIEVYARENVDGLRSISIYKKGALVKSFTLSQVTNCDPQLEKCYLIYSNTDAVVDWERSKAMTPSYKKVFKDGVTDQEKFLNYYPAFTNNDSVYITDSKKTTHIIDLKTDSIVANISFNDIYPKVKRFQVKAIADSYNPQTFNSPRAPDNSFFPNLVNGDITGFELAKYIGMRAVRLGPDYSKYKVYQIKIQAYISKNGKIEIINLTADKPLPVDKIKSFFIGHKYDVNFLPAAFDKWYFDYFFLAFRNISDEQAIKEKEEDNKQKQLERESQLTLDSINGVYIPQNLEECFIQLDKKLPIITKNEMRSLKARGDMLSYHFSLGMWIRNNWGLWKGSRLLMYFHNRGFDEPDSISSIILDYYYYWLIDKKNTLKEFEEKYPPKSK